MHNSNSRTCSSDVIIIIIIIIIIIVVVVDDDGIGVLPQCFVRIAFFPATFLLVSSV